MYPIQYYDLALIELKTAAVFNEFVAPACLPLTNGTEFQKFTAIGWGNTDFTKPGSNHLLKVGLERFNDTECSTLIEKSEFSLNKGYLDRTQICAGSRTTKADTCQGDSGGPLFVDHTDYPCMFLLVGVTSFGNSGCGNTAGVYTRVNIFVEWIENVVWNATTFA